MLHDVQRAQHIRQILIDQPAVAERTMFGGLVFMVNGHIACGLFGDELLVRIGAERCMTVLEALHIRPFQMGKRQSKGWVLVGPQALGSTDELNQWVQQGINCVLMLPAK